MIRRTILLLSAMALVAVACTSGGGAGLTPSPSAPATGSPSGPAGFAGLPNATLLFAELADVPLLGAGTPAYAGPATPHALDGVVIARSVRRAIDDPSIQAALAERGFVVVPADFRLFHFAYQGNVYEGWPVFVTTDVAYHVWHQVFDKVLRSIEQDVLLPELETLVTGALEAAHTQVAELAGTPLADAASRVEQLYQVAAAELGLPVTLGPLAEQEKALVEAHGASEASPIVGTQIDYSLFTPRGHYTRNADLTRYFLAMSVLGQLAFCVPGTIDCPGLEPARMSLLASRVLTEDPALVARWRRIYEPTAFLVGLADDYTPPEVAAAAAQATPAGLGDPSAFADDGTVTAAIDALVASRSVLINPDRASIRLMGTRFVIDSYIFDQLIYPNVGTNDRPRSLPSAVDLPAAFGSEFAYGVLDAAGETGYANYDAQLDRMQAALADRPERAWGSTVYDAWLHALEPSFVAHGEAFPDFMRTDAWAAKAQQSGLGSFAELRHDTILYVKQAMAEGGDGLPIPERRNWVEPEPVAFGRLAAVTDLMRSGLGKREVLTREQSTLLSDAEGLFAFLERIASDELAARPISARDNQRLTFLGDELESFWIRSSDLADTGEPEVDQDAAIVADVASGGGEVLEVGTGRIDRIYVLVPDDEGTFQVAVGGVYSFYEFRTPAGERLSDELWRAMLDQGTQPERPAWEQAMFAG